MYLSWYATIGAASKGTSTTPAPLIASSVRLNRATVCMRASGGEV